MFGPSIKKSIERFIVGLVLVVFGTGALAGGAIAYLILKNTKKPTPQVDKHLKQKP